MYIVIFIAVLFVLVLVHELGHFLVAKKTGMRVDEFGIGFPPRLLGVRKGETVYTLNAVPLGGFVKIFGEDAEEGVEDTDRARAFGSRPLWAQALVLIAGVTANVLFAWLLFTLAFTMGMKTAVSEEEASATAALTVLSVLPDSPAEKAGIAVGDVIQKVKNENGHPVDQLFPSTVSGFIQEYTEVTLTTVRGDEEKTYTLSSTQGLVEGAPEKKIVGITMGLIEEVKKPFFTALYDAGIHTVVSMGAIVVGIFDLLRDTFFFKADFSQVAGPVGIAGLVGDAASLGVSSLLIFTAFISLNLAVINILPFPALDGGRLLFVCIEALKGSPVSSRIAGATNAVGFFLLIALMLVVTYNDILRLL